MHAPGVEPGISAHDSQRLTIRPYARIKKSSRRINMFTQLRVHSARHSTCCTTRGAFSIILCASQCVSVLLGTSYCLSMFCVPVHSRRHHKVDSPCSESSTSKVCQSVTSFPDRFVANARTEWCKSSVYMQDASDIIEQFQFHMKIANLCST